MAGGQEGSQKTKAQNVQKPKKNKGLIVVLVVLVLGIVGLIVSLVSIAITNNNRDLDAGWNNVITLTDGQEIDCSNYRDIEDYVNIGICIETEYNNEGEGDVDALIKNYDQAIAVEKEKGDLNAVSWLLNERSSDVYLYTNDCDLALGLLDKEDLGNYPEEAKGSFYSRALSLAIECSNTDEITKWEELLYGEAE